LKPIVHSQKHYVQQSRSSIGTVSIGILDIIDAVQSTVANLVDEVVEGANIKAVFVEMWILDSGNDGSFIITLEKRSGGSPAQTFTTSNALGTYSNKKNILYTTQGLSPNDGIGNPVPVIRQWFKIPKGKQRFGLGDQLVLNLTNNGTGTMDFCGFFLYKELT